MVGAAAAISGEREDKGERMVGKVGTRKKMPDQRVQARWAPGGGRTRWRLERRTPPERIARASARLQIAWPAKGWEDGRPKWWGRGEGCE